MPSTSKLAATATSRNAGDKRVSLSDSYGREMSRIREKYKDRGESGKAQMKKELKALDAEVSRKVDKINAKEDTDSKNVKKYGKDAMKSRGFAKYNKGGMTKKSGYAKGGMTSCGASNPAARPVKKVK
jgi:hypothetical protein